MSEFEAKSRKELPRWLISGAFVLAVIGLVVLAAIEIRGVGYSDWIPFALLALIYVPIQIVTESILSVCWESKKWVVKLIPVLLLVGFYGVILIFK